MPESVKISVGGNTSALERDIQRALNKIERSAVFTPKLNSKQFALGRITGEVDDFNQSLEAANKRIVAFGINAAVIGGTIKIFGDLARATIQVEENLTKINAIFDLSAKNLDQFSTSLFETARNTAQSFDVASKAAEEFARQGLGVEETLKRVQGALTLTRQSGLDISKSVGSITAALNGFAKENLNVNKVINSLIAVDTKFAVSAGDLAEALSRVGSTAQDAGIGFDELIGLVTSAQQITARGGAVIGNALKTIFTRTQRADTLDQLESFGIQVRDLQGNALSAKTILTNLAQSFDTLTESQKESVSQLTAGTFQINQLKAILGDLGKANSFAAQATLVSVSATNEAIKRNEVLNKSLSSLIQNTKTTATELGSIIGENTFSGPLKKALSVINDNFIVDALRGIKGDEAGTNIGSDIARGVLKGIENILSGPGLVIALGLAAKGVVKGLSGAGSAIFSSLSGREKELQTVQGIQKTLSLASDLDQRRFALAGSIEQKEKVILDILNKQNAARAAQSNIYNNLSTRLSKTNSSSEFRQVVKNAAGGYLPVREEKLAIQKGVGGAPSSAKPVIIPNFAFGGGKRGSIVANSSEYIVPNFANGGSAIFNQEMAGKYGLPKGAKKINAAGGLLPLNQIGGNISKRFGLIKGAKAFNQSTNNCNDIACFLANQHGYKIPNTKEALGEFIRDYKSSKIFGGSGGNKDLRTKGSLIVREKDNASGETHVAFKYKNKEYNFGPASKDGFSVSAEIPLGNLAQGYVPNFMAGFESLLGEGFFGQVRRGVGDKSNLIFKQFKNIDKDSASPFSSKEDAIKNEFVASKLLEKAGIPVAKVKGTLKESFKNEGLLKEFVSGSSGSRLSSVAPDIYKSIISNLKGKVSNVGLRPTDLRGDNIISQFNENELNLISNLSKKTRSQTDPKFKKIVDIVANKTKIVDPGLFSRFADGYIPNFNNPLAFVPNFVEGFRGTTSKNEILDLLKTGKTVSPTYKDVFFAGPKTQSLGYQGRDVAAEYATKVLEKGPFGLRLAPEHKQKGFILGINSSRAKLPEKGKGFGYITPGGLNKDEVKFLQRVKIAETGEFSYGKERNFDRFSKIFSGLFNKQAAEGFIPNFNNPLVYAIERELKAGVPSNQIYIDKDSRLKSNQNPEGLLIANRRDEPSSGRQGVDRVLGQGLDPKKAGSFATGYIPNFATFNPLGTDLSFKGGTLLSSTNTEKVNKALLNYSEALQLGKKSLIKQSEQILDSLSSNLSEDSKKKIKVAKFDEQDQVKSLSNLEKQQAAENAKLEKKAASEKAAQQKEIAKIEKQRAIENTKIEKQQATERSKINLRNNQKLDADTTTVKFLGDSKKVPFNTPTSQPLGDLSKLLATNINKAISESESKKQIKIKTENEQFRFVGEKQVRGRSQAFTNISGRVLEGGTASPAQSKFLQDYLKQQGQAQAKQILGPGSSQGAVKAFVDNFVKTKLTELNNASNKVLAQAQSGQVFTGLQKQTSGIFRGIFKNAEKEAESIIKKQKLSPEASKILREQAGGIESKRTSRIQNAALIGSFLLPAAAGLIPEGKGGTTAGKVGGAVSGAFQGAGTGAAFGSFFGPLGTIVGGIGGGVVGGFIGFLNKAGQSFQELAQIVDGLNAKNIEQINSISSYIQIQQRLNDAVAAGSSEAVISDLLKDQRGALGQVRDKNTRKQLIDAGSDIEKQSLILSGVNRNTDQQARGNNFLSSLGSLKENKTLFSGFQAKDITDAVNAFVGSVNLSDKKVAGAYKDFKDSFEKNPFDAFRKFAKETGTDLEATESQLKNFEKTPELLKLIFKRSIESLGEIGQDSIEQERQQRKARTNIRFGQLLKQSGQIQSTQADLFQTNASSSNRINFSRQQASLSAGGFSGTDRVKRESEINIANAIREGNVQSQAALSRSIANLKIGATQSNIGASLNSDLAEKLSSLKSLDDIKGLADSLTKQNSVFADEVTKVYNELVLLNQTSINQVNEIKETNRLQEILSKSESRNQILNNAQFDSGSIQSFEQTRLAGKTLSFERGGKANQFNALTSQIGFGDRLGLSETSDTRALRDATRTGSTNINFSEILSTILEKEIAPDTDSINKAITEVLETKIGNTLNDAIDRDLANRIKSGIENLKFDPQKALQEIQSGKPVSKLLEGGNLSLGDSGIISSVNNLGSPLTTIGERLGDSGPIAVLLKQIAENNQTRKDNEKEERLISNIQDKSKQIDERKKTIEENKLTVITPSSIQRVFEERRGAVPRNLPTKEITKQRNEQQTLFELIDLLREEKIPVSDIKDKSQKIFEKSNRLQNLFTQKEFSQNINSAIEQAIKD
jgi:TP901 family phage tail tape measure protein